MDSECEGSLVCGDDKCENGPSKMDCCIGKFDAFNALLCRRWQNYIGQVRNDSCPYTLHFSRRGPRQDFGSQQQFQGQMFRFTKIQISKFSR